MSLTANKDQQIINQLKVLFGKIRLTTGNLTAESASVENVSSVEFLQEGEAVSGTGIPEGTTILSIESESSIILSAAATETGESVLLQTESGFRTDIGKDVRVWDDGEDADDDLEFLEFRDTDVDSEEIASGLFKNVMSIEVSAYGSGLLSDEVARNIRYDILQALKSDISVAGLVDRVEIPKGELDTEQSAKRISRILMSLELTFRTTSYERS